MFCTECGANIADGTAFCTECGHPVSDAGMQPAGGFAPPAAADRVNFPAPGSMPAPSAADRIDVPGGAVAFDAQAQGGLVCKLCGASNPADFAFCMECGSVLAASEPAAKQPAHVRTEGGFVPPHTTVILGTDDNPSHAGEPLPEPEPMHQAVPQQGSGTAPVMGNDYEMVFVREDGEEYTPLVRGTNKMEAGKGIVLNGETMAPGTMLNLNVGDVLEISGKRFTIKIR